LNEVSGEVRKILAPPTSESDFELYCLTVYIAQGMKFLLQRSDDGRWTRRTVVKDAYHRDWPRLLRFGSERRGEHGAQASHEGATVHTADLRLARS
jgi:hypothetical protein